jgi:tripartite-type tricarboxylate transporter receptor subunit TctC
VKIARRRFLQGAGAAIGAGGWPRSSAALEYPTRPVRLIVGFPAGGTADLVGRILAQWLSERLGKPVIVENKPGASTNIALQTVAHAPADGYTLGSIGVSNALGMTFYKDLPFNFLRDIAAVAGTVSFPMVMEVHPSVPVQNLSEFIAHAGANPGKINMASFGTGTISHLAGELFKLKTRTDMIHLPYRGAAPMLVDLLAGQAQAAIDSLPASLPHIRQGALRALAVTTGTRSDVLPDVQTVGEVVEGYEASVWTGIGAPKGTPPEIVERLNREINAGLTNPAIRARFAELGATPIPFSPADFGAFVEAETRKWGEVIKFSGVKQE